MARRLENWLAAYNEYTQGIESPPVFNLWVGLSTLAAAAQRKIYLEHDFFQTHSNMFVILVSPPGRSRKGTAMKLGKGLLKSVSDYGQDIHFSTQASSVAALVQQFVKIKNNDHQSLTTFSSELGSLLGTKNDEVTMFLTDIYDCNPDWDKQTVGRGLELIERPWLNMLGATTPSWMGDNLSKNALEGGFVSRTVFVYEDTRLLVALPRMSERQKKLRQALIHDLAHIAGLKGVFKFSEEAEKYYVGWYEDPKRLTIENDPRLSTYYERKSEHVKKVAMLLALSERDDMILHKRDLVAAVGMLNELEPGMKRAFMSVGRNPYSTDLDRIAEQIEIAKRISYKQLLAMNIHALEKSEFDDSLATLLSIGRIERAGNFFLSLTEANRIREAGEPE